ncbi:MAG: metallopeptidase TldD-related protein [Succinivibrionaceae bacterium]|nr:metallopeptidase TldD-related protein [Succinivibrionaceae bacterium]
MSDYENLMITRDKEHQIIAEKAVEKAIKLGADEANVSISLNSSKGVVVRNGEREGANFSKTERLTIEVLCDGKSGETYTTDLTDEDIDRAIRGAIDIASYTTKDPFAGLPNKEEMAWDNVDLDLYHPEEYDLDERTEHGIEIEKYALGLSPLIVSSTGIKQSAKEQTIIYANSLGFSKIEKGTNYTQTIGLVAQKDGKMERGGSWTFAPKLSDLWKMEKVAKEAIESTTEFFGGRSIKTGSYPVIIRYDMVSEFIEALLGALSGRSQYLKSSFLLDSISEQIAPEWFNLEINPAIKGNPFAYSFDCEGVAGVKENLIDKGIVTNYLLSSYSARKLNMKSNGHCGEIGPIFIKDNEHNVPDLKSLCQMMHNGVIIGDLMGSGFNYTTGDFSFGARGFMVENGVITYPIDGITIAGNIKKILKEKLVAIANDADPRYSIQMGSMLLTDVMIAGE